MRRRRTLHSIDRLEHGCRTERNRPVDSAVVGRVGHFDHQIVRHATAEQAGGHAIEPRCFPVVRRLHAGGADPPAVQIRLVEVVDSPKDQHELRFEQLQRTDERAAVVEIARAVVQPVIALADLATLAALASAAGHGRGRPLSAVETPLQVGSRVLSGAEMDAAFDKDGKVTRKATFTILQNGVLIQDHVTLEGGTGWINAHTITDYKAHGDKGPIQLQDHGNPVRYRNIWVRELKD